MDRGWPHNFERKVAIRSKTYRRKAVLLKQNNKEEKEILSFVTQHKPFSVYYKRSFHEKVSSHTKPTTTLPTYLSDVHAKSYLPPWYKRRVDGTPPQRFLFCLHWKAFDLLNKMRYILWMVALLEACYVTNNGRHLCRYLGFYQELEIRLKQREIVIAWHE